MKYTNKHNLPDYIYNYLSKDEYQLAGCPMNIVSVTTLIGSIREAVLSKRYEDKLECDIIDVFYSKLGTCLHNELEKTNENDKNYRCEVRFYLNTKTFECKSFKKLDDFLKSDFYDKSVIFLSGQVDMIDIKDKKVIDHKLTGCWSFQHLDQNIKKYESQINLLAFLVKSAGFNIEKGEISQYFRDWSGSKTFNKNYPDINIKNIDVEIYDSEKIKKWIIKKIKIYEDNLLLSDNELLSCTNEEKWRNKDIIAIMKEKTKRAIKIFYVDDVKGENRFIDNFINNHKDKDKLYKEIRLSNDRKCEKYCDVDKFCNQYIDSKKNKSDEIEVEY